MDSAFANAETLAITSNPNVPADTLRAPLPTRNVGCCMHVPQLRLRNPARDVVPDEDWEDLASRLNALLRKSLPTRLYVLSLVGLILFGILFQLGGQLLGMLVNPVFFALMPFGYIIGGILLCGVVRPRSRRAYDQVQELLDEKNNLQLSGGVKFELARPTTTKSACTQACSPNMAVNGLNIVYPSGMMPGSLFRDMTLCPHCNKSVPKGKFCQHCGQGMQRMCPNCETGLSKDVKFCKQCGLELPSAPPPYSAPPLIDMSGDSGKGKASLIDKIV